MYVSKAVLSQSTARPYFPRPVFSTSTGRPYYPRMDNVRPRASSSSPPTGFFNTRTVDRPKSPKPIIKSKWVKKESTAGTQAVLPQTKGEKGSVVTSPTQTWRPKGAYLDHRHKNNGSYTLKKFEYGNPEEELKDHAIIDSGCSGSMTGDKDKLSDFKDYKGGYVAFGNDPKGGRITGKGTIKTSCIDFENVSYVKELKFNLLSVSQICDKKHNVLFTDSECLILSPEFKIVDENLVLLKAPRKNDHRRLEHVNFKNINKLAKSNLVSGLPSKTFKHDHSCLACRKGKQHKASCKKLEEKTVREPLELLHMDLFRPVLVESLNRKKCCLVKGIQREYSIARTPQQNGVAERKNRTLIEAARTMLADSLLPIQFWAEAVHTAYNATYSASAEDIAVQFLKPFGTSGSLIVHRAWLLELALIHHIALLRRNAVSVHADRLEKTCGCVATKIRTVQASKWRNDSSKSIPSSEAITLDKSCFVANYKSDLNPSCSSNNHFSFINHFAKCLSTSSQTFSLMCVGYNILQVKDEEKILTLCDEICLFAEGTIFVLGTGVRVSNLSLLSLRDEAEKTFSTDIFVVVEREAESIVRAASTVYGSSFDNAGSVRCSRSRSLIVKCLLFDNKHGVSYSEFVASVSLDCNNLSLKIG
ncbi:ribonuclease H-like domain-containing protein [Tanacetum coccineum]